MDNIGHRLALKKGITQEHYAAIQTRISSMIEELTEELEDNRRIYQSCTKCNRVFFIDKLTEGVCPNC